MPLPHRMGQTQLELHLSELMQACTWKGFSQLSKPCSMTFMALQDQCLELNRDISWPMLKPLTTAGSKEARQRSKMAQQGVYSETWVSLSEMSLVSSVQRSLRESACALCIAGVLIVIFTLTFYQC